MATLLIVDDDKFIREGLKRLIDWESLGITHVSEADGAYEALELMEARQPHIVLTDIRMPKGDGLYLIEQIRHRNWKTFIVVLSGYNDYEYVRTAMKYQVEDYLMKPVDANELTEIIASCTERYQGQFVADQMQRESFQLLKNNILLRWAQNRIQDDQLREKLKFLQLPLLREELYQIGLIDWRGPGEAELPKAEEQFRSFAILNSMEEALREANRGIAFLNEQGQVVLLFAGRGKSAERFGEDNQEWAASLSSRYGPILKTPWTNYFGQVATMPRALHESYAEAFSSYLEATRALTGRDPAANLVSRNPITRQVELHLHEHYGEQLSLQLLAMKFNVNNVYLGRLFKKETGLYFNDYLNDVRLGHAKRMLADTTLKATDIAASVGFLDPNYFFRKFKKMHGISPSDYRMSLLAENDAT